MLTIIFDSDYLGVETKWGTAAELPGIIRDYRDRVRQDGQFSWLAYEKLANGKIDVWGSGIEFGL